MSCQGNAPEKEHPEKPEVVGIDDHVEDREPTDNDDVDEKMDKEAPHRRRPDSSQWYCECRHKKRAHARDGRLAHQKSLLATEPDDVCEQGPENARQFCTAPRQKTPTLSIA